MMINFVLDRFIEPFRCWQSQGMQTLARVPRRLLGLRPLWQQGALIFRPSEVARSYAIHPLLQKNREALEKKKQEEEAAKAAAMKDKGPPRTPLQSNQQASGEQIRPQSDSPSSSSLHPILQKNRAALELKRKLQEEEAAVAAQANDDMQSPRMKQEPINQMDEQDALDRANFEENVRIGAARLMDEALEKIRTTGATAPAPKQSKRKISIQELVKEVEQKAVSEEEKEAKAAAELAERQREAAEQELRTKLAQRKGNVKSTSKKREAADIDLFNTAASLGIAVPDEAGYKSSFEGTESKALSKDGLTLVKKEQEARAVPAVQSLNTDIQRVTQFFSQLHRTSGKSLRRPRSRSKSLPRWSRCPRLTLPNGLFDSAKRRSPSKT